ncbi:MAG: hypothetical protein ACK4E5_13000 [Erythrobacter cryptus]
MPEPRYRDAFAANTRSYAIACPVKAARHVLRNRPEDWAKVEAQLAALGFREAA